MFEMGGAMRCAYCALRPSDGSPAPVSRDCRGDEDIDAKRSRPSIGKPVTGHARKERVLLFGTDQRITSGPAAKRPHSKAEYMTAPERFADSQIPLAPRAPSIHDPSLPLGVPIFCNAQGQGTVATLPPGFESDQNERRKLPRCYACARSSAGPVCRLRLSAQLINPT